MNGPCNNQNTKMQPKSRNICQKHSMAALILVAFYLHVTVVYGYFVKNCNIKGSLKSPDNLKALCNKRTLNTVPEDLPCQTRVLDISQNKISKIAYHDLAHLPRLTNLNVSHNLLHKVEDGALSRLWALQELNLAFNRLTTIQGGFFQDLFNLTVLRLNNNIINYINASAFVPLKSLIMINISRNHLLSIRQLQSLFILPNLESVYAASNGFPTFQTWEISNTSLNLKVLDLSHNPLQVFSITTDVVPILEFIDVAFVNRTLKWDVQDKRYLRNVKRLNFTGSKMLTEDITAVIQMVNSSLLNVRIEHLGRSRVRPLIKVACLSSSLTVLRLEGNDITSVSDQDFKFCKRLTTLDISTNNLLNLSALAFSSMENISSLDMYSNKLKNVPTAIKNLSTLEFLDLSYNDIKVIRCLDLAKLTNLQRLHIYRNPLISLEQCAFQNLNNLKEIMIGSDVATVEPFRTGLQNLEMLDMARNKLSSIYKGHFQCLVSLTYLYLQDNQITHIEPGAFQGLQNLILLDLQSNRITQASIQASVFSGLPRLKHLFLNNNYISYPTQKSLVEPPFASLQKLDSLAIHSQGMGNIPTNFFKGLTFLHVLWAGSLSIKSIDPQTFMYTPKLQILDLSKNELTTLSPKIFKPLKKLYRLVMVKTSLQSFDFLDQANLTEIKMLFLRQNAITVINKTVIEFLSELIYLDLEHNGFLCDCSNAWFINWTIKNQDTQVLNADTFKCNYPIGFKGKILLDLDVKSCSLDVGFFFFVSTTSLVLLTLLGSFLYHFLKWQVVFTYYLFLAFLYDSKHQRKQKTNDFQYDAFISYNTHDELWVMRELLPQLESQQGWRLCLHHRDFQPGKPILDNIVDGIYGSRKTICVISRHYLESEWCSSEIQVASFRLFDEKKDVLIMVFLEDIPAHQLSPYHRMRSLIKRRTYLSWPKPGEDKRVFWQKMERALEIRENSKERNFPQC
ncbi:toll-like receptor 13 [Hoplias malabaricus]|uniref:toll-like receptor 13 n=1 Tax=Hoplias malabaricus TaxID=27720 RepID=UPI00346204C7